jgi:hypothetical protein
VAKWDNVNDRQNWERQTDWTAACATDVTMTQQLQRSSKHVFKTGYPNLRGVRGCAVVEALRYKPEGRGIDSRWFH